MFEGIWDHVTLKHQVCSAYPSLRGISQPKQENTEIEKYSAGLQECWTRYTEYKTKLIQHKKGLLEVAEYEFEIHSIQESNLSTLPQTVTENPTIINNKTDKTNQFIR